jgi:abortive infection bacteriophage resistance protein
VNLQQNGDKPFVRHFKTKYTASAHLPIWMAVELMSLGNVTSMYQGCTDDVRDLVARHVGGISNTIFGSWPCVDLRGNRPARVARTASAGAHRGVPSR